VSPEEITSTNWLQPNKGLITFDVPSLEYAFTEGEILMDIDFHISPADETVGLENCTPAAFLGLRMFERLEIWGVKKKTTIVQTKFLICRGVTECHFTRLKVIFTLSRT
jgi:hypothetical protein